MRKTLACCLATLVVGSALIGAVGCKPEGSEQKELDTTKTQLTVGNYSGGVAGDWLKDVIANFEAEYADFEFEPGKKGVQLWLDSDKSKYTGSKLKDTIASSKDIIFGEFVTLHDFVKESGATTLDITDVVKGDMSEFGQSYTIESGLSDLNKKYFSQYDGKYYMVPFFDCFVGLAYDVDLFDSKRLYFKSDNTIGAKYDDTNRGTGPDGVSGTYDDGLPRTYDEFFQLCAHMKNNSITPMIWTGQHAQAYSTYISAALFADYEGKDRYSLEYNAGDMSDEDKAAGKNVAELVTGFDADGRPQTEEVVITRDNYKDLAKQAGRYYAYEFIEKIVDGDYYSTKSFDNSESHLMAQADFLESTMNREKIAMLIDGTWWPNEADSVFDDMESIHEKYSRFNRRFGFLPMPKQSLDKLGKATLVDNNNMVVMIKGNINPSLVLAAKTFLKYTCSNEVLKKVVKDSGFTTAIHCNFSESEFNELSFYTQYLINMIDSSDLVYQRKETTSVQWFIASQNCDFGTATVVTDGKPIHETVSVNAFKFRNVTARAYFEGLNK